MLHGTTVAAFLCIVLFATMMSSFRTSSLPMLRTMANINRAPLSKSSKNSVMATSSRLFATIPDKKDTEEKGMDLKSKISGLWKMYGYIAVGTYAAVYITTLSSIFVAMDYDIFNAATFGFDPVGAVKKVCDIVESATGNKDLPGYIRENPRVGTFAISWVMTKFTEPIRLGVTIAIVPTIARFFGRAPAKNAAPK